MKNYFTSYSLVKQIFSLVLIVALCSCNSYKELTYLENVHSIGVDSLVLTKGTHEAKIMPNDILSITVNSEIKGAAEDFNLPLLSGNVDNVIQTQISNNSTGGTLQNYLVNKDGIINFPVLGELRLKDMTIKEAQNHIADAIYPQYIATRPIVNIRHLNFAISVLGEVNKPGIYKTDNGQITILDALAAAGDMTIFGKRDNILLVRTQADGELAFHRINLHDKNTVLNKDLFYLQQNDKLYIQVNKAKGNSSRFGTLETVGLSALSVIISIIAIATR